MAKERKPKKELTYSCYIIIDDAAPVPLDSLSPEQWEEWQERMCARLSRNLSDYYTQHPDEYIRLCESLDRKEAEQNAQTEHDAQGGRGAGHAVQLG